MRNLCRFTFVLSLVIAGSLPAGQAQAAGNDLDRSFGGDGKVIRSFAGNNNRSFSGTDVAVDVVTQQDRKVVVLLSLHRNDKVATGIARFHPGGRIDRRFGTKGLVIIRRARHVFPGGLVIQPNGRLVASFTAETEDDRAFGAARLLGNGRLDPSFDVNGIRIVRFRAPASSAEVEDVVLGPHRKIIVVGRVYTVTSSGGNGHYDFGVARLEPNGDLDAAFSQDGRLTTDFAGSTDEVFGGDIDSKGRLVAAGWAAPDECCAPQNLAIARYLENGDLDSSFSGDGLLTSDVARSARDVIVMPNDRIAVAGGRVSGDFLVARFTESGELDGSFSNDGAQTVDFAGRRDSAEALSLAGRRLVVAGVAQSRRRGPNFGVARLRVNGDLDTTFSADGKQGVDLTRKDDAGKAVAVDRTGDIVVAGSAHAKARQTNTAIVRLEGKLGRR